MDTCDNCGWMTSNPHRVEEGFILCDICYEEYEEDKIEDKPMREKGDEVSKMFVD